MSYRAPGVNASCRRKVKLYLINFDVIWFDSKEGTFLNRACFCIQPESVTSDMTQYYSPVLIVIGTLGNLVAIITLQSRSFGSASSTKFILTALALCDVSVLYTSLMFNSYLTSYDIYVFLWSSFSCKLIYFLTYFCRHLASWTLVLLTIERTISVLFPLRCRQLCSTKRAIIAWLVITASIFAINSHFFFGFYLFDHSCASHDPFWSNYYDFYLYWINAIVTDILPFCFILLGNIIIIGTIVIARRWRLTHLQGMPQNNQTNKPGRLSSTTYILILVSIAFLLSHTTTLYFIEYTFTVNSGDTGYFIQDVMNVLYYANDAFEFVFYFVSGSKFRTAFLETFHIIKMRKMKQRRYHVEGQLEFTINRNE